MLQTLEMGVFDRAVALAGSEQRVFGGLVCAPANFAQGVFLHVYDTAVDFNCLFLGKVVLAVAATTAPHGCRFNGG